MNMIEKSFLVQNMDKYRNIMFHQILSDFYLDTLQKKEKVLCILKEDIYLHELTIDLNHY